MAENFAAQFPLLVSREHGRNAIRDALKLFVGRGRRYTVKELANSTGVPDWQINQAMIEGGSPENRPLPPEALISIMFFLGAEFTNKWAALAKQGAFDLPDDEPDPGELAADTSEDTAKVVRMAADQDFENDCPQQLRQTGARFMARGAQLVAIAARV